MRHLAAVLLLVVLSAAPGYAQVELAYDDGTAEKGFVWDRSGSAAAVRFSAPGCVLTGARFWVISGVFFNDLGICVLDANGLGGAPGDTLVSYFRIPVGQPWEEVTFNPGVTLPHSDFYVVYVQTGGGAIDSDIIGVDSSSPPDGRSWLFLNGAWSHLDPSEGDVMIRALVFQPTPTRKWTWGEIKDNCR